MEVIETPDKSDAQGTLDDNLTQAGQVGPTLKILKIEPERRRLALSLKQAEDTET